MFLLRQQQPCRLSSVCCTCRCLIPDIYHGKLGIDKEEAHHLYSNLDWPRAVEELSQAVQFLKEEGSEKVGAIGFCMGGALAVAACQHCGIDCAAPFYLSLIHI